MSKNHSPIDQMIRDTMVTLVDPSLISEIIATEWDKFTENQLPSSARDVIRHDFGSPEFLKSHVTTLYESKTDEIQGAIEKCWAEFMPSDACSRLVKIAIETAFKEKITYWLKEWMSENGDDHIKVIMREMMETASSQVFQNVMNAMLLSAVSSMNDVQLRACQCGTIGSSGQWCTQCNEFIGG